MSLRMARDGTLFLYIVLLDVVKVSLINAICVCEWNAATLWRHVALQVFVVVESRVAIYGGDVCVLLALVSSRFLGLETGSTLVTFGRSLLA